MQHYESRSEKRERKYSCLINNGQTKTLDYLYKSEIVRLQKRGFVVNSLSTHPVRKSLWLCEVIFPQN